MFMCMSRVYGTVLLSSTWGLALPYRTDPIRLKKYATDVVLSYNVPVIIADQSSSAETADADVVATMAEAPETALAMFRSVADSLSVNDYSIFGS